MRRPSSWEPRCRGFSHDKKGLFDAACTRERAIGMLAVGQKTTLLLFLVIQRVAKVSSVVTVPGLGNRQHAFLSQRSRHNQPVSRPGHPPPMHGLTRFALAWRWSFKWNVPPTRTRGRSVGSGHAKRPSAPSQRAGGRRRACSTHAGEAPCPHADAAIAMELAEAKYRCRGRTQPWLPHPPAVRCPTRQASALNRASRTAWRPKPPRPRANWRMNRRASQADQQTTGQAPVSTRVDGQKTQEAVPTQI